MHGIYSVLLGGMCTKGEENPRLGEGSGTLGSEEKEGKASMPNRRVEGKGDGDPTSTTGMWQQDKPKCSKLKEIGKSGGVRTGKQNLQGKGGGTLKLTIDCSEYMDES